MDCPPEEEAKEIRAEIKKDVKKPSFFSKFKQRLSSAAKTSSCVVCGSRTLSKTQFCKTCRKKHPDLVLLSRTARENIRQRNRRNIQRM